MATVVDIIQSVMPSACTDGEDIEIPVDELDTYTLRQLQDFVQNALAAKSKKRSVPPSPVSRATTPRSNPPKKSRTSSATVIPQEVPPPTTTASTVPVTNTQSSAPTFFSNQSYIPNNEEQAGRNRSNSLDFFPADENDVPSEPSVQNSDAWQKVAEQSKGENMERQNSGSWGDALYEKHVSESRKIALQAEV